MHIQIKRAYDAPQHSDGMRVLVDRLWPRGITKEHARVDLWLKDVAPSTELRKWFAHDAARWTEFCKRYKKELQHNPAFAELQAIASSQAITLVYSAKDSEHNQAVVLKALLEQR
ncbi:MAG: DUF488 domain-containing protein [Bradyrhizobiaceae bacterium]|nr:DUF488 domain-containing protein [Bradyrhizobiaceae bacterium]